MTATIADADELIVTLTTAEAAEDAEAEREYLAAVVALAAGELTAPNDVPEIIRRAGKTAGDLARDVADKRRRLELGRQAATRDTHLADLSAADRELARLDAELAAVIQQYRDRMAPHTVARQVAHDGLRRAGEAEQELRRTYAGPLREEAERVARQMESARRALIEEERLLAEAEALLASVKANPSQWSADEPETIGRRVASRKAAVAAARERSAALLARSEQLEREMRQP